MTTTDPRYLDRVAERVAQRIRERGTVFNADELATVAMAMAMALDCSASDLLPLHLLGETRVSVVPTPPANPPTGHAPWCTDTESTLCGRGTSCYWSPDDGPNAGVVVVVAERQTAKSATYGRENPLRFVGVTMSRNLDHEFQHLSRGRDQYLVSLNMQTGWNAGDEDEMNLTVAEAREVARRLFAVCDLAGEDDRRTAG